MPYILDFSVVLGSSQTGLTLQAQLVDSFGSNVGTPITTGFVEIGNGNYLWNATAIPDNHQGGVIFSTYPGDVIKAFTSINPQTDQGLVELSATGLDQVIVELGVNARQALSIISAVLAGQLLQTCPSQVTISAINNPGTVRVVAQTTNGERLAVVLTLP